MPYKEKPAKRKGPPTKNEQIDAKDAEITALKNELQGIKNDHTQLKTDHDALLKAHELKKKENTKIHREKENWRTNSIKFENLHKALSDKVQQYKKADYVQANDKLESEKANLIGQIKKSKEIIAEKDEKITEMEELNKINERIQEDQADEIRTLKLDLDEKDLRLRKATFNISKLLNKNINNNTTIPDEEKKALINEIRNNSIGIEPKNFRQIINFYLEEINNSLNDVVRPNGQTDREIRMPAARIFISALQNGDYKKAQTYALKMEEILKQKNLWSTDSGDPSIYRKCPMTRKTTAAARLFSDLAKLAEIIRMHKNPTQLTNDYKTANSYTGMENVCLPSQMSNQTNFPRPKTTRTFDQKFLQVSESSGHSSIDIPERSDSPSDQTETCTLFEPSEIDEVTSHITLADSVTGEKFTEQEHDYSDPDDRKCLICFEKYGDYIIINTNVKGNKKSEKVKCQRFDLHTAANGESHHFCKSCIDNWNNQQDSGTTGQTRCPLCNENVTNERDFPALR